MPSPWLPVLAILANSRPYEGFYPRRADRGCIGGRDIWQVAPPALSISLRRVILPVVSRSDRAPAAGMGYYYWRVTGTPFRMTYQVNRDTYATAPYFLWQSPKPEPAYNHTR